MHVPGGPAPPTPPMCLQALTPPALPIPSMYLQAPTPPGPPTHPMCLQALVNLLGDVSREMPELLQPPSHTTGAGGGSSSTIDGGSIRALHATLLKVASVGAVLLSVAAAAILGHPKWRAAVAGQLARLPTAAATAAVPCQPGSSSSKSQLDLGSGNPRAGPGSGSGSGPTTKVWAGMVSALARLPGAEPTGHLDAMTNVQLVGKDAAAMTNAQPVGKEEEATTRVQPANKEVAPQALEQMCGKIADGMRGTLWLPITVEYALKCKELQQQHQLQQGTSAVAAPSAAAAVTASQAPASNTGRVVKLSYQVCWWWGNGGGSSGGGPKHQGPQH